MDVWQLYKSIYKMYGYRWYKKIIGKQIIDIDKKHQNIISWKLKIFLFKKVNIPSMFLSFLKIWNLIEHWKIIKHISNSNL